MGANDWRIDMPVMVERHGDMGRGVKLRLRTDGDGDVHVICDGVDTMTGKPAVVSVEFCTARGGGRSPRVREALRDLIHIVAAENEENPWPPNDPAKPPGAALCDRSA